MQKKYDENKNEKLFESNVRNTCKLHKAYLNPKGNTCAWLMTFHGFKEFIDKMHLNGFVNMPTYNVLNLKENNNNNEITDYSESYCFNDKYLEHLKRIIKHNNDIKE